MRLVALSLLASAMLLPTAAPKAQCGGNGNSILEITSTTGQVLQTGVETIIRLSGNPGDPFWLMFDIDAGQTYIPGIGTICLSFNHMRPFAGVIPPSGLMEWPKTVCGVPCGLTVCGQAILINPTTTKITLSNSVCSCFCLGCQGKLLDLTTATYVPYTGPFPVDVEVQVRKKEASGDLIGKAKVAFDPANRPAFPATQDGILTIQNIAMGPKGFTVLSMVDGVKWNVKDSILPNETYFQTTAGSLKNADKVHTSCSKPIGVGLRFGSYLVTAFNSTMGACSRKVLCAGKSKIGSLEMKYNGGDCSKSSNAQGTKATCSGSATAATVFIRSTDESDPNKTSGKVWFSGKVNLNGTFTIDSKNGGENKLDSATFVHIFDETGTTLLQTLEFHTSCSQPLAVGNVFGAIEIVDFTLGS